MDLVLNAQRDERLGWMGDADLTADSFAINYDYAAFQDSFLRDMVDAQVRTHLVLLLLAFHLPSGLPFTLHCMIAI